jgi:hypothetical protein
MALAVRPAIPASQIVSVIPSVLPAGGAALDLIALILTQDVRFPIGTIQEFANATDLANYAGPTSQLAALGSIYFNGPDNATKLPGSLLVAQYPKYPVAGYLRGGSVANLTLAALQAINSSLTVPIDGTPVTQTINLASATSFSNAANIIGNTLGIKGPQQAIITGSLAATVMTVTAVAYGPQQAAFTGSLSTTTMTVTAVASGTLAVGQVVVGTGITAGTKIAALGSGAGGVGTYILDQSATTESAESIIAYSPTVALSVGEVVSGTGITPGTYIASFGTGAGGVGTYNLSASATTESAETITVYAPGVTYDPLFTAFVISSGTTGAASTLGYASGAAAISLSLTSALGAVLSAGAAATNPATFMPTITAQTMNWASFMTTWEPSDAEKEGFATWNNSQRDRFVYAMWDTSAVNIAAGGPSAPVAFINNGALSGICIIHEDPNVDTVGGELAAFVLSWIASLDFSRRNGKQTEAFKHQAGLAPQVFSGTVADYLISYGMNFYGDYTTANEAFIWLYPGTVSGDFLWLDDYVNQIWLNNQLQLALMVLLDTVGSIPYNAAGYALISAAVQDPINQAVNFGAIQAGVPLSIAQAAEVNAAAGIQVDQIITQRGWYFQVVPASPQVRQARQSPSCTLWYCSGGSVQAIVLSSVEVE